MQLQLIPSCALCVNFNGVSWGLRSLIGVKKRYQHWCIPLPVRVGILLPIVVPGNIPRPPLLLPSCSAKPKVVETLVKRHIQVGRVHPHAVHLENEGKTNQLRKGWSIYRWSGLKSWGLWRDKHAQESKPGWTALSVQGPRGACREVSELACPTHELCHVLKYQSPGSSPGGQSVWCWFCDKILTLSVARQ